MLLKSEGIQDVNRRSFVPLQCYVRDTQIEPLVGV